MKRRKRHISARTMTADQLTKVLAVMLAERSAEGDSEATAILEIWQGAEFAGYARYCFRGPLALLTARKEARV
jgi:hypothetical protein